MHPSHAPRTVRKSNTMNRCFSLSLTLCVCLFVGCGNINDNQPARLISTVPAEGEYIRHDGSIHLCFDKPVRHVGVNDYAALNRHGKLSTEAWEIEVNRLELWDNYFGFHPEKLVQLEITFEDDAGRHRVKLNVRRPGLHIDGWPLEIIGGTVTNGAKDIDPELVGSTGIQIAFDKNIAAGTVVLRPKDGSPLKWIAEWRVKSVTLYPPNGDRLQNGTEYILEIIGVKDAPGGEYNFEICFTTKE